jgi:signal transduction histidine kinase
MRWNPKHRADSCGRRARVRRRPVKDFFNRGETRVNACGRGCAVATRVCGDFGHPLAEHLIAHIVDRQTVVARLRRAEARARELESVASSGASAKARFLAQINHDLRTPLNAILGFSEIIRERRFGDDFERYAQYAGNIHTSGQRLLAMIEDMIALSVGTDDSRAMRRKSVDLGEIADTAVSDFGSVVAEKRISVRVDRPAAPIRVVADADRVRQMVGNLLSNALRHTPDNGAVTVGVRAREDDVELFVSDTGAGIPKDMIDRVTEPFFRIDDPARPVPGGVGLGLAIVKSLIEAHGGSVRIRSRMGVGTTVRLLLPCNPREKAAVHS